MLRNRYILERQSTCKSSSPGPTGYSATGQLIDKKLKTKIIRNNLSALNLNTVLSRIVFGAIRCAMNNTTRERLDNCSANLSLISSAFLICLYSVSSLTCLFGNGIVLLAIFQTTALRTVSNFFIASLAFADVSVAVFMNPILISKVVLDQWQGNHWLSKLADFMWIQTTTSTTFNLCAVSIDRYVAITAVFRYHTVITRKKCFGTLTFIWIFSVAFGTVRLFIHNQAILPRLWISTTLITVIIPLLLIGFCYVQIYSAAKAQIEKIAKRKVSVEEAKLSAKNRKAAWTAAIIISLFVIMWTPSFVTSCIELITVDRCKKLRIDFAWFWLAFLCFCSSAINPWVYTIRVPEFKNTLRTILGRKRLKRELSRSIAASFRNSKTS